MRNGVFYDGDAVAVKLRKAELQICGTWALRSAFKIGQANRRYVPVIFSR
jgi:hypothetical protein